jgi:hypothetical protein
MRRIAGRMCVVAISGALWSAEGCAPSAAEGSANRSDAHAVEPGLDGAIDAGAVGLAAEVPRSESDAIVESSSDGEPQSTFYVAPGGSDDATGTQDEPFASIARAKSAVRAVVDSARSPVVVFLRGGVYELDAPLVFGPEDSGAAGRAVEYRAFDSERPVIGGGRSITGWQPVPGASGLWSASAGAVRSRQLFVNGHRATRGTGPAPSFNVATDGYDAADATLAGWRRPTDLELVWERGLGPWASPRCPVANVSGKHVTIAQPCLGNTRFRHIDPTAPPLAAEPTRIENALELVDQPGEFYLDEAAQTIFYRPRATEDLANAVVVVPVLESLLVIDGTPAAPVHDLRFEGIQFSFSTWLGPSSNEGFAEVQANMHMTGDGTPAGAYNQGGCENSASVARGTCPYGAWSKPPAAVTVSGGSSITFERDVFAHLGGVGLTVDRGSGKVSVEGCLFTDTSATAIQIGDVDTEDAASPNVTHDVTLSNLWIHDTPVEYQGGVGIFVGHTRDVTVSNSQIDHVPYTGISVGWGWAKLSIPRTLTNPMRGARVLHNLVFAHNLVNLDGDAIYMNSVQGTSVDDGALVEGNLLTDGASIDGGLYTDNGSRFLNLRGNVAAQWHGCLPLGDMTFEDNYLTLASFPHFNCAPQTSDPYPDAVSNNHIVTGLSEVPLVSVPASGIIDPYRDILGLIPL